MRGPTRHPFTKAFALAAIGLAIPYIALLVVAASLGRIDPEGAGRVFGELLGITFVPAAVVGLIARRSQKVWSLWRIGGFWCLGVALLGTLELTLHTKAPRNDTGPEPPHATAGTQPPPPGAAEPFPALPATKDPAVERRALLAQMRAGYAQAAPGAANLIDLLADRFPADFEAMMKELAAPSPPSPAAIQDIVANTLVTIEARNGAKVALEHAPGAALRQLMRAQRDLIAATVANGGMSCTAAARAPTPEIARLSIMRLYALLTAVADGRDHPVDRPQAAPDDYVAFARAAVDRGDDIEQWKGISDPDVAAKEPARVCRGLLSMYDAAVKTDGALGERIIAALTEDQLGTSLGVYQPVLK